MAVRAWPWDRQGRPVAEAPVVAIAVVASAVAGPADRSAVAAPAVPVRSPVFPAPRRAAAALLGRPPVKARVLVARRVPPDRALLSPRPAAPPVMSSCTEVREGPFGLQPVRAMTRPTYSGRTVTAWLSGPWPWPKPGAVSMALRT